MGFQAWGGEEIRPLKTRLGQNAGGRPHRDLRHRIFRFHRYETGFVVEVEIHDRPRDVGRPK
jgi:hypothetical protein